ncbi:DUF1801 domain-containing protein [Paraglaciecola chathamensis]|uniref:DUF1801 domain-containing protein n=1 Tax=Paraglaciecola chathamensis TaxID=368405 RepID=UPI0027048B9D|nr:DUF1801 domain-containing protein [Paraglaciecola chathamensis]MDO6561513.1 DUF1801 domain-containing protein [Paraglaciecola chathamensis]
MEESIESKLNTYPQSAKSALLQLRKLILQIAKLESLGPVSESIKWEQLSYSCPKGSPLRIDWYPDSPQTISLFCHCQTKLIATFKEVYPSHFQYLGNREILLPISQISAKPELAHCISVALKYHQVKNKPLLGL